MGCKLRRGLYACASRGSHARCSNTRDAVPQDTSGRQSAQGSFAPVHMPGLDAASYKRARSFLSYRIRRQRRGGRSRTTKRCALRVKRCMCHRACERSPSLLATSTLSSTYATACVLGIRWKTKAEKLTAGTDLACGAGAFQAHIAGVCAQISHTSTLHGGRQEQQSLERARAEARTCGTLPMPKHSKPHSQPVRPGTINVARHLRLLRNDASSNARTVTTVSQGAL